MYKRFILYPHHFSGTIKHHVKGNSLDHLQPILLLSVSIPSRWWLVGSWRLFIINWPFPLRIILVFMMLLVFVGYLLSYITTTSFYFLPMHDTRCSCIILFDWAFLFSIAWFSRSGVLNIGSLSVTHVHCPPPAWL